MYVLKCRLQKTAAMDASANADQQPSFFSNSEAVRITLYPLINSRYLDLDFLGSP
jgi:hypothetical protein